MLRRGGIYRAETIPFTGAESYRLAPWGDDEILEYMLATHAERCGSVLARLKAAPDRYLPRGLPELWRVVLERMAADESLTNVNAALRQELHRGLPEDGQRAAAEKYCLAELLELTDQAADKLFAIVGTSSPEQRA